MDYAEEVLKRVSAVTDFAPTKCATSQYTVGALESNLGCHSPIPAINVENLSVNFNDSAIIKNVSASIQKGCITALIGPSGCGKTTFLSCINRMIDTVPGGKVSGTVEIDGENVLSKNVDLRALRKKVGMVFQRPNPFPFSIWRNLEMPLREHGFRNRTENKARIETALKGVGLWEEVKNKLEHPALALSGGQQQRLCIARAMILEPEVLLMDEPCSALDPASSAKVENLIAQLKNKYTIVMVTHNLAQARRIANYVGFFWVVENVGELVEFDLCCTIFESPRNQITADYVYGVKG